MRLERIDGVGGLFAYLTFELDVHILSPLASLA